MSATEHDDAAIEAQEEAHRWLDSLGFGLDYVGKTPTRIASIMRQPLPPPEMALPDWIVAGELHWAHAEAESAKTWFALWAALQIMTATAPEGSHAGRRVVYFDEELGERVLAERLLALGASPDIIDNHFAYFPFPGWRMTEEETFQHRAIIQATEPALVVYDTATDALTEAALDENSGKDVTAWVKAYPEQARAFRAATLVLDHTTKAAEDGRGKYAVGSRAKRAKAKVGYRIDTVQPFDRDTEGEVKITRTKNTVGAIIPVTRSIRIGGTPFKWEEALIPAAQSREMDERASKERAIVAALHAHGELSQSKLEGIVPGKASHIREAAKAMADAGLYGVQVRIGDRGAIIYSLRPASTETGTEEDAPRA
jgi:AAA domain